MRALIKNNFFWHIKKNNIIIYMINYKNNKINKKDIMLNYNRAKTLIVKLKR